VEERGKKREEGGEKDYSVLTHAFCWKTNAGEKGGGQWPGACKIRFQRQETKGRGKREGEAPIFDATGAREEGGGKGDRPDRKGGFYSDLLENRLGGGGGEGKKKSYPPILAIFRMRRGRRGKGAGRRKEHSMSDEGGGARRTTFPIIILFLRCPVEGVEKGGRRAGNRKQKGSQLAELTATKKKRREKVKHL